MRKVLVDRKRFSIAKAGNGRRMFIEERSGNKEGKNEMEQVLRPG